MQQESRNRGGGYWKKYAIGAFIFALVLAGALIVVSVLTITSCDTGTCDTGIENIDISESDSPSVFADLTSTELSSVVEYLHKQTGLKVVAPSEATVNSTYIYLVELKVPAKADVLKHLDEKQAQPERWAKAILFRGDLPVPTIEEYTVGPLPNPTTHIKQNYGNLAFIPFAYRPTTFTEFVAFGDVIIRKEVEKKCKDILKESFDATFLDCGEKCLTFFTTPVSASNFGTPTRNIWIWINHKVDYYVLHPLDFQILVNFDGVESSKYRITQVWYNQKLFNGLEEFISVYQSGAVAKIKVPFPVNDANLFSTLNLRGDPFPKKHLRSPVQIEPDGKRYSIKGQHVEYMRWAFDYRMSTTSGPMLFDVRYNRERIVYEISLQEIVVFYSASNPAHKFADYVDSVALIGALARTLISGADCPDHAKFLPAKHVLEASEKPIIYENAFCIFEQSTGVPLRRHHSYGRHAGTFYEGMLDDVLILRTILTVANYDYIFDFIFHQNGAIELRAISTGYILPSVFSTEEHKYGFRLHNNIVGNLHHHMFHFRVDVDIQGTWNRFETLNFGVESVSNTDYSSHAFAQNYTQIMFERELKRTETQGAYRFNFDKPRYLLFHNDELKTEYGEPRAYRLFPQGISKQTLPEGQGHEKSISWARYQVAVTKYKEAELRSSSLFANWDALDPIVNFQNYIDDNEDIVDEDLVAWVTLGIHHIPHTEDLPVTPTPGGHLQFFLLPYNYFPEDPAMASQNAVRLDLKEATEGSGVEIEINRYGYGDEAGCARRKSDYDQRAKSDPSQIFGLDGNTIEA